MNKIGLRFGRSNLDDSKHKGIDSTLLITQALLKKGDTNMACECRTDKRTVVIKAAVQCSDLLEFQELGRLRNWMEVVPGKELEVEVGGSSQYVTERCDRRLKGSHFRRFSGSQLR